MQSTTIGLSTARPGLLRRLFALSLEIASSEAFMADWCSDDQRAIEERYVAKLRAERRELLARLEAVAA